jgi:hypothetical protein
MSEPARRLPLGLLGMLALLAVVEGYFARHDLDCMTVANWEARFGRVAARQWAPDSDVLCLGDSLIKMGVVPSAIEARTGLRAVNLALSGGQPPASFVLLRRALEAGARPRAVVLDFFPSGVVRHDPWFGMEHWPHLLDGREAVELAWTARDPSLLGRLATMWLLPSVRGRSPIRQHLMAVLAGQASPWRPQSELLMRNWAANRGAQVMPGRLVEPFDPNAKCQEFFPTWACHPVNSAYLIRTFELTAARRIPVVLVLPPINPILQALSERSGFADAYETSLRRLVGRYPHVVVLDGRHAGYAVESFIDADHLGCTAALAFSDDLGAFLASRLANPTGERWARLPVYRPRPIGVPSEDVDQSRLALARRARR